MAQTLTILNSYTDEQHVASTHTGREKTVARTRQDWEERYHSLMELCPHLVSTIIEGKLASINQSGVHLLAASQPDQLVGKALV
jgi:hypothetical protein